MAYWLREQIESYHSQQHILDQIDSAIEGRYLRDVLKHKPAKETAGFSLPKAGIQVIEGAVSDSEVSPYLTPNLRNAVAALTEAEKSLLDGDADTPTMPVAPSPPSPSASGSMDTLSPEERDLLDG